MLDRVGGAQAKNARTRRAKSGNGPKRRKATSAPILLFGELSELVALTVSLSAFNPGRPATRILGPLVSGSTW